MKTYDETFERVMAERDSYVRRKKERTKYIATGSLALAGVALAVISVAGVRNSRQINIGAQDAKGKSQAALESAEDYTVPDLLTQEISTIYTPEGYTAVSDETAEAGSAITAPGETQKARPAQNAADSGTDYDGAVKAETATENADMREIVTRPATPEATTSHPVMKETVTKLSTTAAATETAAYMNYTYYINSGKYKDYCPGKVIDKDKVGKKIGSVTVTGYWEGYGAVNENKTQKETLSADVYYIEGVSDDVAVCLKFNDKGDALTTNHYYVVINPKADYSPVREYAIGGSVPVTAQTPANGEYVTAVTSKAYVPE